LPLRGAVERLVLVHENGSADDVLILTLENRDSAPVLFGPTNAELVFEYRDSETELVGIRDWLNGCRDGIGARDEIVTNRIVRFPLVGEVRANGMRSLVAHVFHRNLVRLVAESGSLLIDDPLYVMEFEGLPIGTTAYRATVVFPRDFFRRRIVADDGAMVTTRTVSWDWGAVPSRAPQLQMAAHVERGTLVSAPRRIDDAIAEVYGRIVGAYLNEWPTTTALSSLLRHKAARRWLREEVELPSEKRLARMSLQDQCGIFRGLLEQLVEARREALSAGNPVFVDDEGTEELAERIATKVTNLYRDRGIQTPLPKDTEEALFALLNYQAKQRLRPHCFSANVTEPDFHEHLAEYIADRCAELGDEVPLSGGRLDLRLGDVPLELKVDDLQGRPEETIRKHRLQGATYGVGQGKALAIEMILDRYRYPERSLGAPGVDVQWFVDVESTETGATGTPTQTIVVTLVVQAYLPIPSRLRRSRRLRPTPWEKAS
jgi:hypothetical protein